MDNEEDYGDVSDLEPFKGYRIIPAFEDYLTKFSTYVDTGDASTGPQAELSLSTSGMKKAIRATCDEFLISPRDLLNLLRRSLKKIPKHTPTGFGDNLRWLSDAVVAIEREQDREAASFFESLESDFDAPGDVTSFPEPNWRASPHADEIVAFLTNLDYPEQLIEELAKAVIEGSIDDEDGSDLYDPDSIEETFTRYAPQSAEEFNDAYSRTILSMYM